MTRHLIWLIKYASYKIGLLMRVGWRCDAFEAGAAPCLGVT